MQPQRAHHKYSFLLLDQTTRPPLPKPYNTHTYIDDAKIYTTFDNIEQLEAALQTTVHYDKLVGQAISLEQNNILDYTPQIKSNTNILPARLKDRYYKSLGYHIHTTRQRNNKLHNKMALTAQSTLLRIATLLKPRQAKTNIVQATTHAQFVYGTDITESNKQTDNKYAISTLRALWGTSRSNKSRIAFFHVLHRNKNTRPLYS